MLKHEEALICDLAETYNIYDYRQLPPTRVAVFAFGLRDNSRIKMILGEQKVGMDTLLLAGIVDRLNLMLWRQTENGQKGINAPPQITDSFLMKQEKRDFYSFDSGEEFEKTRNKLAEKISKGGG